MDKSRPEILEDLSKEVSAFANAEGGTLVIGMREEKRDKERVAAELDGFDGTQWPAQQLQQLLESNVQPHLVGLRVRYVPLDGGRVAAVIDVPQGTTAYQAADRRYYGRSEFEARPLPDHEVRLRMHRGRLPRAHVEVAQVKLVHSADDVVAHWLEEHRRQLSSLAHEIERNGIEVPEQEEPGEDPATAVLRKLGVNRPHLLDTASVPDRPRFAEYSASLRLLNIGELSLPDLLVDVRVECAAGHLVGKDTTPQPRGGFLMPPSGSQLGPVDFAARLSQLVPRGEPAKLWPGRHVDLGSIWMLVPQGAGPRDGGFRLRWTVYLDDTLPCSDEVDLGGLMAAVLEPGESPA